MTLNIKLNIYYHTTGGMRKKSQKFFLPVIEEDIYDIIVIIETWLVPIPTINNEEFFPSNYTGFRRNRHNTNSFDVGGGIIIAVNAQYKCHQMIFESNEVEIILVEIKINSYRQRFFCKTWLIYLKIRSNH